MMIMIGRCLYNDDNDRYVFLCSARVLPPSNNTRIALLSICLTPLVTSQQYMNALKEYLFAIIYSYFHT